MKKKFVLFSTLMLLLGIFVTSKNGDNLLGYDMVDKIYYPFVWFLALVPLSLFALTLNDQKHKFWLKFTSVFFVISMFFVYMMPEYGSGIVSIDRELTNWFSAGLYSFISIIYFIVQFIKSKNQITYTKKHIG